MLWFCRDLCSFGGEGVVILLWVYVHFSICGTSLLYCFSVDLCWIGGGGGVSLPLVYFILLYVKLICCSGFSEIYARLEEGVESVCHGYMCIPLYVKLICC